MHAHATIPALRYRGTGSTVYLEIGFDARLEQCPGAQWLTLRPCPKKAGSKQEGDALPRDLMKEQVIKIGRVRRQITVEAVPGSQNQRRLGISLGTNSPYRLIRHTHLDGGGVSDEEIFPFLIEQKR